MTMLMVHGLWLPQLSIDTQCGAAITRESCTIIIEGFSGHPLDNANEASLQGCFYARSVVIEKMVVPSTVS